MGSQLERRLTMFILFVILGRPTNFGLLDSMKKKWESQIADETKGDFLSTYSNSYLKPSQENFTSVRYAIPRAKSTSLHPYNKLNKDLKLRGTTSFKSPEKLPEITPVTAQILMNRHSKSNYLKFLLCYTLIYHVQNISATEIFLD